MRRTKTCTVLTTITDFGWQQLWNYVINKTKSYSYFLTFN